MKGNDMNIPTIVPQSSSDMPDELDNTQAAYLGGASIARERMANEAPLNAEALAAVVAYMRWELAHFGRKVVSPSAKPSVNVIVVTGL